MDKNTGIALLVLLALVTAAATALLIAYLNERLKRIDGEFISSELLHALRKLVMACPSCHGSGTLAIPGATIRCRVCGDARITAEWLTARYGDIDDRR